MNFLLNKALGDIQNLAKTPEKAEPDPDEEKKKQEHAEALAEQEAERKAKHERFEAKREKARDKVRKKHGLKSAQEKADELEAEKDRKSVVGGTPGGGLTVGRESIIEIDPKDYDEGLIGQAQYRFDDAKMKFQDQSSGLVEKMDEAKDEVMRRAPDQCKQQ